MPTITREWSIVYGSLTIGGTSDAFLLRKQNFGIFESYRQARITCEVVVIGTSESDFKTQNQTFLNAIRTPRQRLRLHTPTDLRDYNPTAGASTNTGFDADAEADKIAGDRINTGRSRAYRASFTVQLPADLTGQSGRTDNFVATEYEPNRRRTIAVTGTYTALAANDATAQYVSAGPTYATSVLPSGVTWQFISETRRRNDTDKVIEFSRKYREITANQQVGAADNTSVVDQALIVSREELATDDTFMPGTDATTNALVTYNVEYTGVCDIEVTTYTALLALWDATLRAHVVGQLNDRLGAAEGSSSVDSENLSLDLDNNTIRASFKLRTLGGALVLSSSGSRRADRDEGVVLTPISTGKDHEHAQDRGPPSDIFIFRTREERSVNGGFTEPVVPQGFVRLRLSVEDATRRVGRSPGHRINLFIRTTEMTCQRSKPYGNTPGITTSSDPGAGNFLTGQDRLGAIPLNTGGQLVNPPRPAGR